MEGIIRICATSLTTTEQDLYSNTDGAIVTTIIMYNPNSESTEVTLNFDGVAFLFTLSSKETKIMDSHFVVNSLKATGNLINIHISGIQMEVVV